MEISPRHKAALEWAAAGYPVFPCLTGAKEPACKNSFKDSTTDLAQINRWWSQADYNLAICPEYCGWAVIELDCYKPAWTEASNDLVRTLPETYEVESPSQGRHLYFAGSVPPSVGKLAPAIDTRGVGSYVLIPPSIVGGKPYRVINDRDPTPLPDFITTRLATRDQVRTADDADLDRPLAITRARSYLADIESRDGKPVDGAGSDAVVYEAACWILGLGISPEKCRELLAESWCSHFDDDWIELKVKNAVSYRQNEGSVDAPPDFNADFGNLPGVKSALAEPVRRSKFYPLNENELYALKDPKWLIPELCQEQGTVMVIGKPESFKTFIVVDVGLAIASGQGTFGHVPSVKGVVIYAAGESKSGIKRRHQAWKAVKGLDAVPLFFVNEPPLLAIPEELEEFKTAISDRAKGQPVAAIVLDTQSVVMAGMNENDAKDASLMTKFAKALAEYFSCLVFIIHHQSPKTNDKDGYGRGSSGFFANYDTVLEVTRPDENGMMVEVRVRKQRDGEKRKEPWYFEAKKAAQSLVLQPVDKQAYQLVVHGEDPISPVKVGAALVNLGAKDIDTAKSTHVLALELCPMVQNEGPERYAGRVKRLEKALRARSKDRLAGYTEGEGTKLLWFAELPSPENPDS